MNNINNQFLFQNYIFIVGIWFSAFVGLLPESINKLALYVVLPFLFLLTFLSHKTIRSNKYMNILSVLFIWILFSVCWASNIQYATQQIHQILGSFLLCFIFSVKGDNEKNLPWLYFSFIILLAGDWYYAYNDIFGVIDVGVDRLNDEKLNANTMAYHTYYATFAVFMLGEFRTKWNKLMRVFFFLMIPLSFITSMITASRQVLIIQIPLIILLLYGRYYRNKRKRQKCLVVLALFVIVAAFLPVVSRYYEGSTLQKRNEIEVKDDSRLLLALDAIKVGNENFPLGVGANNYIIYSYNKHFSHNTYTELYANEGVVGVLLYMLLLGSFIKTQWKRYRETKDIIYFYLFVSGIIYAFDGIFYVFYPHLWLISFLILISTHSETYYKKKCLLNV